MIIFIISIIIITPILSIKSLLIILGSGNGMGGLLIDKLYSPREVIISDMESHMKHINHNIALNSGEF